MTLFWIFIYLAAPIVFIAAGLGWLGKSALRSWYTFVERLLIFLAILIVLGMLGISFVDYFSAVLSGRS